MRRLFWLTLGAVLGAWTVLRVQRFARQFGPRGVAGRAVGLGAALRSFATDVRVQMRVREAELRGAQGGPPAIGVAGPPGGRRYAVGGPARTDDSAPDAGTDTGTDIDKDGH
ncbi:MAG TPA: hypothetical protein VF069_16020 [Streptosporangiaceae bacterium]